MKPHLEAQQQKLEKHVCEIAALRQELAVQIAKNAAMYESEERFRTIIETANEGIWLFDPQGRTTYLNHRMAELLGAKERDVLGKALTDFCFEEDMTAARARIEQNLLGHTEKYDFRLRRADGGELHVLAATNPIHNGTSSVAGVLCMFTDITDRHRADAEREELLARAQQSREQAEASSRSKDEFIALISHELRAPLNAMLGWARVLKDEETDPHTRAHAVEVIERSARTQQKLIEDLLDTSRITSGNLRLETGSVDLAQVVKAAADTMRPAAEAKEIAFKVELRGGSNLITGDPDRLQQVLWNLLSNAVKFTPKGGQVTVRLERADPYIRLTVTDTGIGISPEFLPYVFHRFYRADSSTTRRFGGLGLGLSLVRHLVELHGGSVEAESPGEGHGATFRVNLPVRALRKQTKQLDKERNMNTAGASLSAYQPTIVEAPNTLSGLWVLVVDDEADARDLVATLLKQSGANVSTAASAAEAYKLVREGRGGARPDVLVSDIGMPDEDGYQLLRQVRALGESEGGLIPAIALTAFSHARDRVKALSTGFQTHISKPVEPEELMMVIANLTGRAWEGELWTKQRF